MMSYSKIKQQIQSHLKYYPNEVSYWVLDKYLGDVYLVFRPHVNKICGLHLLHGIGELEVYPSTFCNFIQVLPDRLEDGTFDLTADLDVAVQFLYNSKDTKNFSQTQESFINLDEI